MDLDEIILCGHPNVVGCPNHGDIARELVAALRYEFETGRRVRFSWASHEDEPIPFVLTAKGRAENLIPFDPYHYLP
jgi:hypothetical protein